MRIAQVLFADAWGGFDPSMLETGIGGREGAMIRLGMEWAKAGHQVTNFAPVEKAMLQKEEGGGLHEYVPVQTVHVALSAIRYDAVVAWEFPGAFAREATRENQRVRLVEMQCAELAPSQYEHMHHATGFVFLSEWARGYGYHQGIDFHDSQMHVLPNGVDLSKYSATLAMTEERRLGPKRFVYSSSPDRGLVHLLRMWPKIRKEWPDAELRVAYGVHGYADQTQWLHWQQGEVANELLRLMRQKGIIDVGKVGQTQLAKWQQEATALLYPCDTHQPTETGCITIIENMAAGAPVITTDCDCLAEEFDEAAMIVPLPFNEDDYLEQMHTVLDNQDVYYDLVAHGLALASTRDWKDIAPRWLELFENEIG